MNAIVAALEEIEVEIPELERRLDALRHARVALQAVQKTARPARDSDLAVSSLTSSVIQEDIASPRPLPPSPQGSPIRPPTLAPASSPAPAPAPAAEPAPAPARVAPPSPPTQPSRKDPSHKTAPATGAP